MYVHTYINVHAGIINIISSIRLKRATNVILYVMVYVSLYTEIIGLRKNEMVDYGDTWIGCY